MKARIHSIAIEQSNGSFRFVLTLSTEKGLAYFSTSMVKPDAVRITAGQLKATFDDLNGVGDPIRHMFTNRSKFVGRDLDIEVTAQKDKHGDVVINPKTGLAFTQVRLVPSSKDVPADAVDALWAQISAAAAKAANGGNEVHDEDLA